MAAGEGTRLRPLTERWPKPVLPIDGRPVLATLLRESSRRQSFDRVWVVTGHLAEQVERLAGDGSVFGVEVELRSAAGRCSAQRTRCSARSTAGAVTPVLVSAADTVFRRGDVARFADEFGACEGRRRGGGPHRPAAGPGTPGRSAVDAGRVSVHARRVIRQIRGRAAPLWGIGPGDCEAAVPRPARPTSWRTPFSRRSTTGDTVIAVEIGKTRDLTYPLDLVEENFPYLRAT